MTHFCVPPFGIDSYVCIYKYIHYILRYNWLCDKAFQNTIFCVKDFSFQAPLLLLLELLKVELSVESYLAASGGKRKLYFTLHCHRHNDSALRWAVVWAI